MPRTKKPEEPPREPPSDPEQADREVEDALLQTALDGGVTAQIFWLKNRCPDKWRERPEAGEEDEGGGVVLLPPVLPAEQPPREEV